MRHWHGLDPLGVAGTQHCCGDDDHAHMGMEEARRNSLDLTWLEVAGSDRSVERNTKAEVAACSSSVEEVVVAIAASGCRSRSVRSEVAVCSSMAADSLVIADPWKTGARVVHIGSHC